MDSKRLATSLHAAAYEGTLEDFKRIHGHNDALLGQRDEDQRTPLHWAVSGQKNDIVEYILGTDIGRENVDAADAAKWTPFLIAASTGNITSAKMLLGCSANIAAVNENGHTALHYAASKNHLDLARQVLLPQMTNVDVVDLRAQQTPLHRAVAKGYTAFCQLLIDANASVNQRDRLGNTPLHLAAEEGHGDIVILLLENGADPKLLNNAKKSSVDVADKKLSSYFRD